MKKCIPVSLMMVSLFCLISGGGAGEALAASPDPGAKTLKIGVTVPLTGPISTAGIPHSRGTQLAADWINGKGGVTVRGQKYLIELVMEDEKDTLDTALTAVTKLVQFHKVKFIVGTISPPVVAADASITEPAGVLRSVWHGEGAAMEINSKTPLTFRVPVVPRDFAPQLLKYQVKAYPNAKKIAILFLQGPAADFLLEKTKKAIEAVKLNLVGANMYPVDTRDLYPVLTKVLDSKPDAIYCTALPHQMGGILKTSRELGFEGPIFNLSPTSPEVVRAIAGKTFATECIVPAPDSGSPSMTPMMKEIRKMVLERYKECNFDYMRPWDALWWMVQAIQKAQSLDTSVVAKTWEKMDRIESSTGIGRMGGQQSYGINHIGVLPFAVTRLMKGEMEHVGWFVPDIP